MSDADNPDTFKSVPSLKISEMVRQNVDALNHLRRLGLNQYEAQAYLALALSGHGTAGELAERAELPRPRVYDVLEKLQEKGFVALKPGRPVRYAPNALGEALKTLKRQKEASLAGELAEIDEIGGHLASKIKQASVGVGEAYDAGSNVWTLRGREAIYSKLASMVGGASDKVIVSSNPGGIALKLKMHKKDFETARKRGVKVSFISPLAENSEISSELTRMGVKLFSKQMPTRMILADDEALVFLTNDGARPEDEVGLWIKNPEFVETLEAGLVLKAQK
jgi:sugar-specific transcriptional regulator TrmB